MRCPYCGSLDDKVIESRSFANGDSLRRRRECGSCGRRFTSYENIEELPLMVVKRDGRREPFERSKLQKGIQRAMVKRPIATQTIEAIVNEIDETAHLRGRETREIAASELGELALEQLFHRDKVAYIRFASVYRHFENMDEFVTEINKLGGGQL